MPQIPGPGPRCFQAKGSELEETACSLGVGHFIHFRKAVWPYEAREGDEQVLSGQDPVVSLWPLPETGPRAPQWPGNTDSPAHSPHPAAFKKPSAQLSF